jgi:hypothetical protein
MSSLTNIYYFSSKASRETEQRPYQQLKQQEQGNNTGKAMYKDANNKNKGDSVK